MISGWTRCTTTLRPNLSFTDTSSPTYPNFTLAATFFLSATNGVRITATSLRRRGLNSCTRTPKVGPTSFTASFQRFHLLWQIGSWRDNRNSRDYNSSLKSRRGPRCHHRSHSDLEDGLTCLQNLQLHLQFLVLSHQVKNQRHEPFRVFQDFPN
ncbi:hypothetical protein FF38_06109 [Lucilia cuprina]|uniref:Uncharacterized protein n=1 Tax=Lucilia cuprina TaxID=7375 RepID=A0A0L0CC60_LUCCU|nr:hypothetical protein FF38_06109 [Lucilia cuprina]